MKMSVDEEKKIVELGLTAAEQNDTALMESLKPLYEAWRERQYRPVVFRSGRRDLLDLTEELLLHNRTVAARRDLERESPGPEPAMGITMGM